MYCRNCGKEIDDKAVVCTGCGVPSFKGRSYCQNCGGSSQEKAEICVKCGVKLKCSPEGKDWLTTLILSIIVGEFGVDRFYTGHVGLGILKLFTFGGCLIWWLIDVILIATGKFRDSEGNLLVKK